METIYQIMKLAASRKIHQLFEMGCWSVQFDMIKGYFRTTVFADFGKLGIDPECFTVITPSDDTITYEYESDAFILVCTTNRGL